MMKRPLILVPILATLLLAACSHMALFKAPVTLDDQFKAVTTYEFGQSRLPLTVIDDQVRTVDPDSASADYLRGQLDALLTSDATLDAKRFALRNLALIGNHGDIPTIAPLLLDKDLSDMARYALRPMDDPAVDKVLCKALDKADDTEKIGIINTLGQRGETGSVAAIKRQLDNPDNDVSRAAIMALGKIGGPDVLKELCGRMADAPEALRPVYTEACLAAADDLLLEQGDLEPQYREYYLVQAAAEAYRNLMASGQPTHIRMAAFRGLVLASGSDAGALIIGQLQGNDPALKQMALVLARQVPGEAFTKAVAGQLETIEPSRQVTLLQILGERGDKAALPQVIKATASQDEGVRQEAIQALGMLGDASTVPVLAAIAATAKGKDQAAARDSLNRLTGPVIDDEIVTQLVKAPADDTALRCEYIRALGSRQAMNSVPDLLELTADTQPKVRGEAYKSLAMIAGSDAVPRLVERIKNLKDEGDQKMAEAALVAAATRSAKDSPAQAVYIMGKMEGATPQAQASLLRALGSIGDPVALPAIDKALAGKDATLVDAAVRALSDWPTPEPAAQLIKLAKSSNEQTRQVLALRGYVRMAGQTAEQSPAKAIEMYKQAMAAAKRPEEKKLVLGGLGAVNDPAGFALIKPALADKALSQEAQVAQLKLADQLAIAAPDAARKAVEAVLAAKPSDALARQARGVLGRVERYDDYISAWQAAGPYTAKDLAMNDQLAHAFAPENDPGSVQWKTLAAPADSANRWKVDLKALYGVDNQAAYLRTNIWSPVDQKVRVELKMMRRSGR